MPRPHLIERLDAGPYRKVTVISAPAGFGKTTLLSEWVAGIERRVAWLSLDEEDNDSTRFLTYLIAALQAALRTPPASQETVGSIGELMAGGPPGLRA